MPTPPKNRRAKKGRVLRWVCTVLTVVLLAGWGGSFWYAVRRINDDGYRHLGIFYYGSGNIWIRSMEWAHPIQSNQPTSEGWEIFAVVPAWPAWLYSREHTTMVDGSASTETTIPLTPFLAALLATTGWLWWKEVRSRRRQVWQCAACSYDRRGLASAVSPCPECGAAPTLPPLQPS